MNRFLAVVFKGFNRGFDWLTEHYGRSVARLVRVSAMVLVLYGGLLYLTYFTMVRRRWASFRFKTRGTCW